MVAKHYWNVWTTGNLASCNPRSFYFQSRRLKQRNREYTVRHLAMMDSHGL